uniref:VWFA domain-containing protein n=1 Tax=Otus sunia TaxID=257818 RepID=A0A8C8A9T2_9STRI
MANLLSKVLLIISQACLILHFHMPYFCTFILLLPSFPSSFVYFRKGDYFWAFLWYDRMKSLQLSSGRTLSWRMALLQYSSTVFIEKTFHDWKGPEAFKSHIGPISYIGHGTYTTYAITNLTQLYMTEGTPGSVKVAMLFTDGVDHPRNPDIFAATADAKHQGIVFFIMGMTRVAEEVSNAAKLRLLASVPASRFIFNLQEKETVEKVLKEMTCCEVIFISVFPPKKGILNLLS